MSTDRLREAAAKLRLLATDATPGPWRSVGIEYEGDDPVILTTDADRIAAREGSSYVAQTSYDDQSQTTWNSEADAVFIASMDPVVAGLLADWLQMSADHAAGRGSVCGSCVSQADALAEAVLA